MLKRVLLVDDDVALCRILSAALGEEGFAVAVVHSGAEGLRRFRADAPELLILDVLLPEMDGLEVCRRVRKDSDVPIILLTSRSEEVDRVTGLDLGADDYLTKPFSTRELCARMRALDRRLSAGRGRGPAGGAAKVVAGELEVDPARHLVTWRGQLVGLTRSEFQVLLALVSSQGVVLTRERLLDLARGTDVVVTDRTVDTFVRRIRKKLAEAAPGFDGIETVFGVGYRYRA